ncbi:MAG: hypothetical protein ACYDHH_11005 [Solirubrobacteraceae bacterium]
MIASLFHFADIFHMQTPFDVLHGDGYNFWSGIGSDFGEVTIIIAVLAWWRHHNCQVKGCWRIHLHLPTAGGHLVCKRHHPAHEGDRLSVEQVAAAHHAGLAGTEGIGVVGGIADIAGPAAGEGAAPGGQQPPAP